MSDMGKKQKGIKILEAAVGAFGIFMAFGWSFLICSFAVRRKKATEKKKKLVSVVAYKEKPSKRQI